MSTRVVLGLTLCALLALAGCPSDGGPDPLLEYTGTLNESGDGFVMQGDLYLRHTDDRTYRNISVTLYDADCGRISTTRLGTLDGRLDVAVTSKMVPEYVVIGSPEFWTEGPLQVTYYEERNGNGTDYIGRPTGSRAEFPCHPS
jgi:hypothetical protein